MKKTKNMCTCKTCNVLRNTTDDIFCENHREDWVRFCNDRGIRSNYSDKTIMEFVKQFQEE